MGKVAVRTRSAVTLLAALLSACSQDVSSSAQWGAGTAAAPITSGSAVPVALQILSPAPGSFLPTGAVTVSGVVRAPSPARIAGVTVSGLPGAVDALGNFHATIQLAPGIQGVTVLVTDTSNNVEATTASYMVGPLAPIADPVPDAVLARLDATNGGLLDALIEDALDSLDFTTILAACPIPLGSVLVGLVSVDLDVVSVSHGPWTANVVPGNGTLAVAASVPQVSVQVVLTDGSGSLVPVSVAGNVQAALAQATTTATLAPSASGPPSIVMTPPVVTLTGATFAVQGSLQGPLSTIGLSLLQGTLVSAIESALSGVLAQRLPAILQCTLTNLAPATVGGVAFTFSADATEIQVTPQAVTLGLEADVLAPIGAGMSAAPGYLAVGGPPPVLGAGNALALAVSPELLAKMTTVAWQSGAMNIDLDAATWGTLGAGLPSLDVAGFSQLVPELATVLPASTPLVVRVRPALPPLLVVQAGPSILELEVGELHVEIWADTGGPNLVEALDVTANAVVPVDPIVTGNALGFVTGATVPTWNFAVAAQPLVGVNASALGTRLSIVLNALLSPFLATVPVTLPTVQGQGFTNVQFSAGGALSDHLVIAGDF